MANSKRSKEGYLMIDNRAGHMPTPEEMLRASGLPVGASKGLFETPTYTCSHCQYVVVMNPQRTREREYCRACDSYICDGCGEKKKHGLPCKTFKQVVDEAMNAAEHGRSIILPF
jgi:hypothetical protein